MRTSRHSPSSLTKEGETASALGGFADPQSPETFEHSKLVWSRLAEAPHAGTLSFYRALIALRKSHACLSNCDKELTRVEFDEAGQWAAVERGAADGSRALLLCNFSEQGQAAAAPPAGGGAWQLALWTGDARYGGGGADGGGGERGGEGGADAEAVAPPPETGGGSVELPGHSAALYVRQAGEGEKK